MQVLLSKKAVKSLKKINEPLRSRINSALAKLQAEPPQGDIKNLEGREGYRLRVGDSRILFNISENNVVVTDIESRGKIYKR
jgi:mRNA interferase RelE/StbE